MIPQPPPGQGPVDPRGAFTPPPAPGQAPNAGQSMGAPPTGFPPMGYPPMMPMMMPPPMYYPPPPPRGRSFAGAIFTTLATSILGLSIMLNVFLLLSNAGGHESFKQETLVAGEADQQVAVLPIHGIIDDRMVDTVRKLLDQVESNKSVKAIVLDIDSPGGGVTASDEIYARINQSRENHKKPIVTTIGALGASGGYYIACASDYIFAQHTSLTGSIGVIMPSYNVHELAEKWGITENTITSDGATYKNAGSWMQPEKPQDREYFQSLINQMFDRFKKVVEDSRKSKLKSNITTIANGKIYTSEEAKKLGLIDDINYAPAAWDKAAKLAGLSKPTVVKYSPQVGWLSAFGDSKFTGGSPQSSTVNINGINVNVDRSALTELLTPKPMYLWRGQ
jgi:protease-4